jgi:hypothetical protein
VSACWSAPTENSTRNLSVALARDIARNIELANLSIQTIVDGLQGPGAAQYPDSVSCIVLFDHATTGKYFDATRYADANGDLVLDQRGGLLQNQNVAQREFFLFHQRDTDPNLHIGLPFRVAQNPDRYEITLSRRVNRADGRFAGVVFATIKLDYFYQLLQNINVGAGGHVVLYRSDGAVLMEFPASTGNLARSMRGTESFKAISAAPDGFVTGPSALDSVNRLRAFRRVADRDLYAVAECGNCGAVVFPVARIEAAPDARTGVATDCAYRQLDSARQSPLVR